MPADEDAELELLHLRLGSTDLAALARPMLIIA